MLGARLFIFLETTDNASPVFLRQKSSSVGEILDGKIRKKTEKDGDDTFDDEDPRPAWSIISAVQFLKSYGEKAAEGTGDCRGREEDCLHLISLDGSPHSNTGFTHESDTDFAATVPTRKVVADARKKPGFS